MLARDFAETLKELPVPAYESLRELLVLVQRWRAWTEWAWYSRRGACCRQRLRLPDRHCSDLTSNPSGRVSHRPCRRRSSWLPSSRPATTAEKVRLPRREGR